MPCKKPRTDRDSRDWTDPHVCGWKKRIQPGLPCSHVTALGLVTYGLPYTSMVGQPRGSTGCAFVYLPFEPCKVFLHRHFEPCKVFLRRHNLNDVR